MTSSIALAHTGQISASFQCISSCRGKTAPVSIHAKPYCGRSCSGKAFLQIASLSASRSTAQSSYLGRRSGLHSVGRLQKSECHKGRGGALATVNGTVEKVTAKELDDILVNERTTPIVIDFYATWCGPCVMLAQELKQLSAEMGDKVRFLKVDTDEETTLASQLRIQGLPTMVFVSNDKTKTAIRTEGLLSSEQIKQIIEQEL